MHSSLDWPQSVPQAPPVFHQTADWRERQQVLGSPGRTVFVSSLNGPAGETAWLSHQRVRPSRDPASEIRSLQQHYTILDDQPLIRLTSEEPVLVPLLMEAVAPLKNAFGEMPVLQVRVQSSDDDSLV